MVVPLLFLMMLRRATLSPPREAGGPTVLQIVAVCGDFAPIEVAFRLAPGSSFLPARGREKNALSPTSPFKIYRFADAEETQGMLV